MFLEFHAYQHVFKIEFRPRQSCLLSFKPFPYKRAVCCVTCGGLGTCVQSHRLKNKPESLELHADWVWKEWESFHPAHSLKLEWNVCWLWVLCPEESCGFCAQGPQWTPSSQPGRIAVAFADFHLRNTGLQPGGFKSACRAPSVLTACSLLHICRGFSWVNPGSSSLRPQWHLLVPLASDFCFNAFPSSFLCHLKPATSNITPYHPIYKNTDS